MPIAADSYTLLNRRVVLDFLPQALMTIDTVEHDGRHLSYFCMASPVDGVATVALTNDRRIVLTRQYRHAVGAVLGGLPSGHLKPGEAPIDGARRELEEETGYRAAKLVLLGSYNQFPSTLKVRTWLFLATGLVPGTPCPDEGEELEIELQPFDELLGRVQCGEFLDGSLQLGVMLAAARLTGEGSR